MVYARAVGMRGDVRLRIRTASSEPCNHRMSLKNPPKRFAVGKEPPVTSAELRQENR